MAKLRCLLMKQASMLEQPLLRMQQQSLPSFGDAQDKLSHDLHTFAQRLLQVRIESLKLEHETCWMGRACPVEHLDQWVEFSLSLVMCLAALPEETVQAKLTR